MPFDTVLPPPSPDSTAADAAPTVTMPPDINSLGPATTQSTTPLQRPRRISITTADTLRSSPPSPRSPSLSSLQAAATINAGLQRPPSSSSPARNSQGLERRRSSLMNNLTLHDPTMPGPGELQQTSSGSNGNSPRLGRRSLAYGTADPHHQRQPSLGEIHQELENEQEAQVNRLLHMIRIQQDQIAQIQRQQQDHSPSSTEPSGQPTTQSSSNSAATAGSSAIEQSSPRSSLPIGVPSAQSHFNRPNSLSRQSSARYSNAGTNSRSGSPAQRPVSGGRGQLTEDFLLGGSRDESAFYQAETQTLTRENQMLKQRIRELERQVAEMTGPTAAGSAGSHAHSPAQNSPLSSATAAVASGSGSGIAAEVEAGTKVD